MEMIQNNLSGLSSLLINIQSPTYDTLQKEQLDGEWTTFALE